MKSKAYVIGVDYGTDSVRSVLVDAETGLEIASHVFYYPRWREGKYCNPLTHQFRQHPLDYIEGLVDTIKGCLSKAGPEVAGKVRGISVDTTGSTPVAVDGQGRPLALLPEFAENPNAMFVLWKDHSSVGEAAEINEHARKFTTNYLQYVGGIYSSEWFWAKLLHILRADPLVNAHLESWVEHCDWIPFLLTGGSDIKKMKRGVCSAGHKALWAESFGGLPPDDFFSSLDPILTGITQKLFTQTYTADQAAGFISEEWAQKLGLPLDTVVGIGAFDAHMGAVGGQIEPYFLSKVMGTSTCDMLVAPAEAVQDTLVKGICGQVPGSVIPGMVGLEAGQSAFGDAYAWFRDLLSWPLDHILLQTTLVTPDAARSLKEEMRQKTIALLSEQAALLPLSENAELAMDWLNGRRTPDADQTLKAAFLGLELGSTAPSLFRALAEATCFGAKAIVDRFVSEGIPVKGLIGLGGVAKKSPYIMQMMADVVNMPLKIQRSEQACALGAAMFAATASGLYSRVEDAMDAMGQGFDRVYHPNPDRVPVYEKRYHQYIKLGHFVDPHLKTLI